MTDITYDVLDSDNGVAMLSIYVEDSQGALDRLKKAFLKNPPRSSSNYPLWFRCPRVQLEAIVVDRVGLVSSLLDRIDLITGRYIENSIGNILYLKGYQLKDKGFFAVEVKVSTETIDLQDGVIGAFLEWCHQNHVANYDINMDNFISLMDDMEASD